MDSGLRQNDGISSFRTRASASDPESILSGVPKNGFWRAAE
jgi:hypothetical protein